jgi:signal transduction histidine kinase
MPHPSTSFELPVDLSTPRFARQIHAATRETNDARAEEIAVICHELRNSLAVLRGAARLLSSSVGVGSSSARSLIERHVNHMNQHIDELLQPIRRNGHDHGLQLSRVDLRAIARYALDDIGPEMTRRGHRLEVKLPGEPVWAHADGLRLEQAFSNLLINAAKYTPERGDIAFSMERENDLVRVRIRDSGIGMEPRMLPRVFGMFVQAGTVLPGSEQGRGIGLALVRNIVEQHGGSVTAMSAGLGLGSEFSLVLPTLQAQ